ncbi:MAG: HEPN domain-containing protein [bacterium]
MAQQVGEIALKALLGADVRDLLSHSLTNLLRELDSDLEQRWQRQARLLDKLDAPTRHPEARGDGLPADGFGTEDGAAAVEAAANCSPGPRPSNRNGQDPGGKGGNRAGTRGAQLEPWR